MLGCAQQCFQRIAILVLQHTGIVSERQCFHYIATYLHFIALECFLKPQLCFLAGTNHRHEWSIQNKNFQCTVRCCYNAVNFLQNIYEWHQTACPSGRVIGSVVGSASDWYSTSVPAMICPMSCHIRPRYNSTRLYCVCMYVVQKYISVCLLEVPCA